MQDPFEFDALEVLDKVVPSPRSDVAFTIDTTGSMGNDIDAVKVAADNIVNQLAVSGKDVRLGLVLYKDLGDPYVTTTALPFTSDTDKAIDAIDAITVGGGGDDPEAMFCAVKYTIDDVTQEHGGSRPTSSSSLWETRRHITQTQRAHRRKRPQL